MHDSPHSFIVGQKHVHPKSEHLRVQQLTIGIQRNLNYIFLTTVHWNSKKLKFRILNNYIKNKHDQFWAVH